MVKINVYELDPPEEITIHETGAMIKASFEEEGSITGDGRVSVLLDAGRMKFPLQIRHRAEGDFFDPLGFGKKRNIQVFFVDEKVPRDERDCVPVVVSGSDIVWIAGYRADERFRATEKREKFLRLIITKL